MNNKLPSEKYPVNTKILLQSGNFKEMTGIVKEVEDYCTEKNAFYGFKIVIELKSGKLINAYKTEHLFKM